jgi:hypothetical protein
MEVACPSSGFSDSILEYDMAIETPSPEVLASMIESIKIHYEDHSSSFDTSDTKIVSALPSRNFVLNEMDDAKRDILYRSVRHLWKRMTGKDPNLSVGSNDAHNLNGAYWLLPGGIIVSGFNHFQTIKENKLLFCSLLDINPIVFERMLVSGDVHEIIGLVISRGGVRMLVDRSKQSVIMQTTEASWPWVKSKLEKMYHKHKRAKVLDLSKPYEGWVSGVTIDVK